MLAISHTTQSTYHTLQVSDIITMLPVMDRLAKDYKYNIEQARKVLESKEENKGVFTFEEYIADAAKILDQIEILTELGFTTSRNNKDIQMTDEILELRREEGR